MRGLPKQAGPACFRQAHTWRGTQNTAQPQATPPPTNTTQPRTQRMLLEKPNRHGPPPNNPTAASPHAVEPAGGPAFDFTHPPNAADSRRPKRMRSDSDPRAIVPTKTADRQRNERHSTELRHPRGHRTMRKTARISCKTTDQPHRAITHNHPHTSKQRPKTERAAAPGPRHALLEPEPHLTAATTPD